MSASRFSDIFEGLGPQHQLWVCPGSQWADVSKTCYASLDPLQLPRPTEVERHGKSVTDSYDAFNGASVYKLRIIKEAHNLSKDNVLVVARLSHWI